MRIINSYIKEKNQNIPLPNDFVFTVDTTNTGSASDTFIIPILKSAESRVNCTIFWGDDTTDTLSFIGTAASVGVSQHTYSVGGIYQIIIRNQFELAWSFNNSGDKQKMVNVVQWGIGNMANRATSSGFMYGCSNLDLSATTDGFINNFGVVTTYFRNCTSLTTINNLNLWSSEDFGNSWGINNMFNGCTNLDDDFGQWDFTGVTSTRSHAGFMTGVTLSPSNYDSTLIALSSQTLNSGVSIGFGSSKYNAGVVDSGTTDGATTAFKLIDSTQNFITTVTVGDIIRRNSTNYAEVISIDSNIQLTLDNDIMLTGQAYTIEGSAAAKARYSVIDADNWTITDGGPV